MPSEELQLDKSYTLPIGAKFTVHQIGLNTRFTMLVDKGFDLLNKRLGDCSALTYRLFLQLAENLNTKSENVAPFHVGNLTEIFGVQSKALYRSLKILQNADLVRKVRKGHYRLNPYVVWCGKTKEQVKVLQEWDAATVLHHPNGVSNA